MKTNQKANLVRKIIDSLKNGKDPAVTGAIIIAPILVTFMVVNWLLGMVATIPGLGVLEITPYFHINQSVKLAVIILGGSLFITGVGKLFRTSRGFILEEYLDQTVNHIPLIRAIYNTTKVTTDTVLGGNSKFGEPVKIEMGEMRLTGFRTGNKTQEGRSIIFIPTSPNVTSGFVVEIDDGWLQKSDETVSEAMTKVLSAGFGIKVNSETKIPENNQI